jgi:hypothetical protein
MALSDDCIHDGGLPVGEHDATVAEITLQFSLNTDATEDSE